jgi:hypothetical protein
MFIWILFLTTTGTLIRLGPTYGEHQLMSMGNYPDMLSGPAGDDFMLPAGAELARQGEARTNRLYREATPSPADGLFHCPWEGESSCNHKPDKLKCNYE